MAERELAIILRARDLASKGIGTVKKNLGGLESSGKRAMSGLTTGIRRVGIAAGVGLVGALTLGVRSLEDLHRTMAQTDAVIKSTGGSAGVTAQQVRDMAQSLEQVTTVDDKVIQDGENMLLTFTGIGKKTFPAATKATLDLAVAMAKGDASQVDMKASAIQVGKALNDPIKGVTALRKVGVSFTDQQLKQIKAMVKVGDVAGAQQVILAELAKEFGNAGAAAGTGFEADMRRVQDAGEGVTQALAKGVMPVLARAAKWLSTKLNDPAVIKALEDFGTALGDAGQQLLDWLDKVDWSAIGNGLKTAKDAAASIVGLFMGLPPWVKTAIVTGWGLNKLSGGALSGVISGLAGGLIKGILGMTAGVVNINAAVVNGAGGLPGAAGGAAATAGGIGAATLLAGAAITLAAAVAVAAVAIDQSNKNSTVAAGVRQTADVYLQQNPSLSQLQSSLKGVDDGINQIQANPLNVLVSGDALEQLRATRAAIVAQMPAAAAQANGTINSLGLINDHVTDLKSATTAGLNAVRDRSEANRIATAVGAAKTAGAMALAGTVAKAGGLAAAAAIRAKNLSVSFRPTIITSVSIRETINTRTTYKKLYTTAS